MKKTLLFAALAAFAAGLAFGGTITVTQPAGGTVTMGAATPIVWTASNVAGNVKIQLIRTGGALVGQLAGNIAAGGSPWNWTVAAPAAVGEIYKIRVRAIDGSAQGESAAFTVAAPSPGASIQVSQPDSTSKWHKNETHAITWSKAGSMPNKVKISLMDKDSVSIVREIADNVDNSGSCPWLVPADVAFGDYRIRVLVKTTDIKDDSDTFHIAVPGFPHDMAQAKSAPLQATPVTEELYANCEKYEETPQIKNWGNPLDPPNMADVAMYISRPKGLPEGVPFGSYVHVGYDYFSYPGDYVPIWTTYCYRSRIWVNMVKYQGIERAGRRLVAAKLHLRQFHSLIVGDSHASCGIGLAALLAPWTDFYNFQVTQEGTGGLNFGSTAYSVDITPVVRKWLDNAWPDCGLLLTSQEVDWGQQAKTCYSSYHATVTLWFEKN
jgi:hypothetical protein